MKNRVSYYRYINGMTQSELAFKVGISVTAILNIEKGHNDVRLTTAYKISKALNVPITVLFDFDTYDIDSNDLLFIENDLHNLGFVEIYNKLVYFNNFLLAFYKDSRFENKCYKIDFEKLFSNIFEIMSLLNDLAYEEFLIKGDDGAFYFGPFPRSDTPPGPYVKG